MSDGRRREWAARAERVAPVAVWLGMSLPAFWVLPAIDDWGATAPLTVPFDWGQLAPGLFWRPFETLNRLLVGQYPLLFPQYLHVISVVGHGLSGWLLHRLALRLGASGRCALLASAVFLMHPGGVSVVWSVDGGIRTISTAFGLASLIAYLDENRPKAILVWLLLATMATLWYETGLRWFLAAPLARELGFALRDPRSVSRRLIRPRLAAGMAVAVIFVIAYFVVRSSLTGELMIAGSGRYALAFHPVVWLRNAAMLCGVAFTTVDTIALLGPSPAYAWAGISLLLGLPLLFVAVGRHVRVWPARAMLFCLLWLLAVVAPHLPQSHVSEFYAHPVVAVAVVALALSGGSGPILAASRNVRIGVRIAVCLFVLVSVGVNTHKALGLVRTGRDEARVGKAIAALLPEPPRRLCVVTGPERAGYSVFVAPHEPGARIGYSARSHWGWSHEVRFDWAREIASCPEDADAVVAVSENHEVVKSSTDFSPDSF